MQGPAKAIVTLKIVQKVCRDLEIGRNTEPRRIDNLTTDARFLLTAAIIHDRTVSTPASAHQLYAAYISLLEEIGINSSNVCITDIQRLLDELFCAGIITATGMKKTGPFKLPHRTDCYKVN